MASKPKWFVAAIVAIAATWLSAGAAWPASAQDVPPALDFSFTRLGTLGGTQGGAYGINDRGDVVGASTSADGIGHATLWRRGQVIDLQVGADSSASDINNNGAVVGTYDGQGFLWRHGVTQRLPFLHDQGAARPSAINDEGTIAGTDDTFAVLWTKTIETQLGPPVVSYSDWAFGINDQGQAVGCTFQPAYPTSVAVLYTHSGSRLLPSPYGGQDPGACAMAINNHRQVAGYSWPDGIFSYRATRWDHDQPVLLDSVGDDSYGLAINDDGWVVGNVAGAGGHSSAVLWVGKHLVRLDQFLDPELKAQGWHMTSAYAINNLGWIAGQMEDAAHETAAWLLVPR
jgi:probable HAF family extracellular repeat protein